MINLARKYNILELFIIHAMSNVFRAFNVSCDFITTFVCVYYVIWPFFRILLEHFIYRTASYLYIQTYTHTFTYIHACIHTYVHTHKHTTLYFCQYCKHVYYEHENCDHVSGRWVKRDRLYDDYSSSIFTQLSSRDPYQ